MALPSENPADNPLVTFAVNENWIQVLLGWADVEEQRQSSETDKQALEDLQDQIANYIPL